MAAFPRASSSQVLDSRAVDVNSVRALSMDE